MHPAEQVFRSTVRGAAALALFLVVPLAGCDRGPRDAPDAAPATAAVEPAPQEEFEARAGVAVQITEDGVRVSQDTVLVRSLELTVINQSSVPQNFRIEGVGIELGNIAPNSTSSIGVRLDQGTYEIVAAPSASAQGGAAAERRTRLVVVGVD